MAALRALLAAVFGIAIGILLLAYPETVIRVQTAGPFPQIEVVSTVPRLRFRNAGGGWHSESGVPHLASDSPDYRG